MFSKVRALRLGALAIIGIGTTLAVSVAYGGNASNADYRKVQQQLQDQRGLNQQLLQLLVFSAKGSQSTTSGRVSGPDYCQAAPDAVSVETTGGAFGVAASLDCAESVSGVGWRIVFRFDLIDASTGRRVTGADGATIKVVAPNGAEALASFSPETDAPFLWAATWDVPFNFAMGAGEYRIVIASKSGQVYAWKPSAVASGAGGEGTRSKVVQVL